MKYVLINKFGGTEEKNTKKSIELNKLYKLCNYKNDSNFGELHRFPFKESNTKSVFYCLYGKSDGRANMENKYEFPPPIDKNLYFGNLCIIKMINDEIIDLTISDWNNVYEKMFGGFEDIGDSDGERSVDTTVYSDDEYTKDGYHKDSFIVDDEELQTEDYI
jgi:hypothetical protein